MVCPSLPYTMLSLNYTMRSALCGYFTKLINKNNHHNYDRCIEVTHQCVHMLWMNTPTCVFVVEGDDISDNRNSSRLYFCGFYCPPFWEVAGALPCVIPIGV